MAQIHQPAIRCWFCADRLDVLQIERDGIIRSRQANQGGPYRLLVCPRCNRENLCERSKRGRWFASPNLKASLLEYLFSQLLDTRPEDFLTAASWYRDNEDRRRYFFERDGDKRYSGGWLSRLWTAAPPGERTTARPKGPQPRAERTEGPRPQERASEGSAATGGGDHSPPPSEAVRPKHLLSPYEILGLSPDASDSEIQAAFRQLAKKWHPDKVYHLGEDVQNRAGEQFRRLQEAYETLLRRGDARRREE